MHPDALSPRRVRLSLLDTYGVRWDRSTFVRDVLQNFFDATPDFRDVRVAIDRKARTVEVSGPATFDLELVAYIGATTKRDGTTAGAFGEGFKICALLALRDFGLTMMAGSGADDLRVLLDPIALGRELCYDVNQRATPFPGSYVRFEGCDDATLAAFETGTSSFRYVGNGKLLAPLAEGLAGAVAVYPPLRRGCGEIYYRRQLRGLVHFYPGDHDPSLSLVHDPPIDALEGDRDRRDLPARPVADAIAMALDPPALLAVFLHMKQAWAHGHEVLYAFIAAASRRGLRFDWPRGWLARAAEDHGINGLAERMGFHLAISAFAKLGMPVTSDHFKTDLATRPPGPLEAARLQVLAQLYADLNGGRPCKTTAFEVFDDAARAAVMGQHLGASVLVGAHLVAAGFDAAAGTTLHELAHETGGETSPAFLGRLEGLLASAIRRPDTVARARERYAAVTQADAPPPPPPPPPKLAAYDPLAAGHAELRHHGGVWCCVFAPPAFPPLEAVAAALMTAAAQAQVAVFLLVVEVTNQAEADLHGVPGIPTLRVSGADVEDTAKASVPGYYLRTYGEPARLALCPAVGDIAQALSRSVEQGLIGDRSRSRHMASLGHVPSKAPPRPTREDKADELRLALEELLCGRDGDGLRGFWAAGKRHAVQAVADTLADDPRATSELVALGKEQIMEAIRRSRELRRVDKDFDDADDLETATMGTAQGALVAAWFTAPEPGREAGERAFHELRALTARLLDLPVAVYLKVQIVGRIMKAAGMHVWSFTSADSRRFDPQALAPAYDAAVTWALERQEETEREGNTYRRRPVDRISLEVLYPEYKHTMPESWQAEQDERVRHSHAVKKAYDDALAQTGDPIAAAQACLRFAERAPSEETPA